MNTSLDGIESTAIEACTVGGSYLREAYRTEDTEADRLEHDVKSSADTTSETRMLEVIQSQFPTHRVAAEESGTHAGVGDDHSPYEWIVDPLDGTNNFESGLPSFASAVTVCESGDPVLGAVYVPMLDDLYVARRGGGVRYNGRPVTATQAPEAGSETTTHHQPSTATIVSVIGHDVKRDPDHRVVSESINRALESTCKRRLESWSPTVHWGLLARGRLDGIVCYRPDQEEQLLGEVLAGESGLCVERGTDWYVAAVSDALVDELEDIATTRVDS
ncbi:inositol monophosphatase family protein [Natrialba sp. SSL1]|uniref:inositol monophosphatase family protein n=1 Tax=Natrialba sp. SSL1 TaxID=1869245 RepID=UPI0008F93D3E|nr:inositol monophosphatase family protein [Natrialba sp. SSL1]OIB58220.1 inositol monophosphatase [Natrialba sp. SSL1]